MTVSRCRRQLKQILSLLVAATLSVWLHLSSKTSFHSQDIGSSVNLPFRSKVSSKKENDEFIEGQAKDVTNHFNLGSRIILRIPAEISVNHSESTWSMTNQINHFEKKRGLCLDEKPDKHKFSYIHNPSHTCFHENGSSNTVHLIIIVPSAPWHHGNRDAIRRTFWRESQWPNVNGSTTKTVFLLGSTQDTDVQRRIDEESSTFGDIVQEDFNDSYKNLTRKTIMGLKWVTHYCRHAKYAMKLDDDSTMNQSRILQILHEAPSVGFFTGHVMEKAPVDRMRTSKFFLSEKFYPNPFFPPYAQGACYLMSTDVVESIYKTAIITPFFPWEDVFVGMCLEKLAVTLIPQDRFVFMELMDNPFSILNAASKVDGFAIYSGLSKRSMLQIWDICRSPIKSSKRLTDRLSYSHHSIDILAEFSSQEDDYSLKIFEKARSSPAASSWSSSRASDSSSLSSVEGSS